MFKALIARFKEGCRTGSFPPAEPNLPPDFRGRPEIDADTTAEDVTVMKAACPVDNAIFFKDGKVMKKTTGVMTKEEILSVLATI